MKITQYPMLLAVSLLAFSNAVVNADEMYVCQSKGAENIITSRPDLYRNCKSLKGGESYQSSRYKKSHQLNRSVDSDDLAASGGLSRPAPTLQQNQSIQKLTVYDRAALYCTQATQFKTKESSDCGVLQAEGIGFINDLLIKNRSAGKDYTVITAVVRNCLDHHKYGEAIDYNGAKECIETITQTN